jgi:ATP-dependent exoDNAse (exonuclease V) beta subunit
MDPVHRQRLRSVADRLSGWRQRVDRMAHSDLLQRCLEESGAYAIYAAAPDGELMLANLRRLFERIRAEEDRSAPGLSRLARWLRAQVDDSEKEEQATLAPGQDAVQIMTVHAAKGLEFPVVAVMKMERQLGRSRYSRLLVKSERDLLVPPDEEEIPDVRPGTLAVVVRHPQRPRETYTPRLLKALKKLDQAQELAESRRLFYVAATRAKERLILAGKQPGLKRDGQPQKLQLSWQKWFEDALEIDEEHKQRGSWEDNQFKVTIVTDVNPASEKMEPASFSAPERINLNYLHERTRSPSIATTGLEGMRTTWRQSAYDWWLRYRVKVRPRMPKANSKSEIRNPKTEISDFEIGDSEENVGTVIGTLVHRLFEMGPEALRTSQKNRYALLQAMAANMLAGSALQDEPDGEEESAVVGSRPLDSVVSSAERLVDRINEENETPIRRLLDAQGEPEVEFLLRLGGWHITGRFDKLLPHPGGYEIVDWKTDQERDWREIVKKYRENQMKLYALALQQSGRAALIDGAVQVHLALLHHGRVEILRFPVEKLEAFASELQRELQDMDQFGE